MKNKIFITGLLISILLIVVYFVGTHFSYLYKQYPENWSIEKWDLKQGWNPKIYRGERSYSKNSDNTIKDNFTGLIWQKKNKEEAVQWEEAEEYCKTLSLDGYRWRLPTINELFYLVDIRKSNPCDKRYGCSASFTSAIDTEYFDIKTAKSIWSNTEEIPRRSSTDTPAKIRFISLATGSLSNMKKKDNQNGFPIHALCVTGK